MPIASACRVPAPRFRLLDTFSEEEDFGRDVREGLTAPRKSLPPRWFYDALGSALFDAICFLPEYYVMRAEAEILTAHAREIAKAFGENIRLVELGSGAARKTRLLLDAITQKQHDLEYVPVDVDANMLERTGRELLNEYAGLRVVAICSDFARPSLALRVAGSTSARTIVLFLGSTIGNLDPEAAVSMLTDLRCGLAPGDALFLGADLRKSRTILDAAYDDPLGVTAAFNLNLLARINRELGGHFALDAFRHRALYDAEQGRIEMHLVSTRQQRVQIDGLELEIAFDEGETIHTESSYKHNEATLAALARNAGFTIERQWMDSRGWFADALMIAR